MIQWVFNHTAIRARAAQGEAANPNADANPHVPQEYLQVVISTSYDLLALDKTAIRDAVVSELAEIWSAARMATLLNRKVVTEHGATFSVRPGVEALRPPQRTPIDGLFLAGDWTDTGWPATMEGAVRSGYLAAQAILATLDQPTRLIRPGLRPGILARWLFGAGESRPARNPPGQPPIRCQVVRDSYRSGHNRSRSRRPIARPQRTMLLDLLCLEMRVLDDAENSSNYGWQPNTRLYQTFPFARYGSG